MRIKKRILAGALALVCALSSLSLTALADEANTVAQPTLHYDFTTGDSALKNIGTADAADAALINGATLTDNGVDLAGSDRQAVELTGTTVKNAVNGSTAMTLSMMVKADQDGGNRTLISYGRGEAHRLVVVTNFGSSTHPRWSSNYRKDTNTDALGEVNFESTNSEEYGKVLKDKWTNITFVQNGNYLALYVNGDLIKEVSDFRDTLYDLTSVDDAADFSAYIGSPKTNIYSGDAQFDGTLSDFRIYDQALSADEVGAVYDETLANVNYGELSSSKIEAENFTYWNRSEVSEGAPKTEDGESYKAVANTKNGLTLTYKNVSFAKGIEAVTAHVKGGTDKVRPDTEVKFYLDSVSDDNLAATVKPYELFTASGWNWVDATAAIDKDISGTHDLIVVMSGTADGGGSYMGNFDYFEFIVNRQAGLNATYYQTKGAKGNDGWYLGSIVEQATGYGNNYNNSNADGQLNSDGTPAEQNALFDSSIDALMAAVEPLGSEENLANFRIGDWDTFRNELSAAYNDTIVHYTGTMQVSATDDYTFHGKIDNGMVIFVDDVKVFEFWGNRSWADGADVMGKTVNLTEGEHKIEAYYVKFGGGQMFGIEAQSSDGTSANLPVKFTLDLTAQAYGIVGFNGDYGRLNTAIGAGTTGNTGSLTGNQNYDASIDKVMQEVEYVGTQILPSVTFGGNSMFRNYASAAGCSGDDAIVIDYTGYITPLKTGNYKFGFGKVDNGLEIEIAGQKVAEYWAKSTWYDNESAGILYDDNIQSIYLEAGVSYQFKATFLELDGGEICIINTKNDEGTVTDARIEDAFVFTTAPYSDGEFDKGIPTLDAAAEGSEVIADLDFSEGTSKDTVSEAVLDTENVTYNADVGAAVMAGGSGDDTSMIKLPDAVTEIINESQTLIIETVVKSYSSPSHGYIASLGTTSGAIALAGLREDWRVKTASTESSYNALPYATWTKLKWVFSGNGVQIYANDELVANNASEIEDLSAIEGNMLVGGRYTNENWKDSGLDGMMTQFRVSVFNQPTLDAADEDATVLSYVNFANDLPEGVENQGVETQNGLGKFTGGKTTAIVFPESMTDEIKKSETTIVEFVVKANAVDEHRIIASLGTTSEGHAHMIMGTRQNSTNVNALKTANNAASNNSIVPGEWTKVRYEITRSHTKIYANDVLVLDADETTNFAMLSGSLKFGQYTVSQWADDGLNGYASEIRVSVKGTYEANYPESGLVGEKELNDTWPSGSGDYYYGDNYKFTNVVPGVYKIAYTISGVDVKSDDWQMRISPKVRSCDGFERRCWVDFRYVSKVGASVTENDLGDKIMVVAVITVPEGYDSIDPGAYIESGDNAGLGSNIDSIRLYTGDYDLAKVTDYQWASETANLSTFNEDSGGLLRALNGTWKPSTRGENNSNNTIAEIKVDGYTATIDGKNATVSVPKADSYNVEVTMEDPYAYYAVSDDYTTITVWSSDDTEDQYTLTITPLAEYLQPDEKGIIVSFNPSGFANEHTWDGGVATTTDDNGHFVMPKGNAGNFWGAYWNDIRPNDYTFLAEGTYKIVYLFDVAEDAEYCDMLLKVFQKNGDTEWRLNENGVSSEMFSAYAVGNKIALSFPLTTTSDLDGFEIGGWKASGFSGTLDGLYICSANCDVTEAFPDYELLVEESPRYFNGGATKAAEEGSYTPSTPVKRISSDATIASVTVDGVAATIDGDNITVEVAKADTHTVEVVTTDANANAVYNSETGKITVTAEDGTTVKEYTLTITEVEKSSDATLASVTVDGVAATISGTDVTVKVDKADGHTVVATPTSNLAKVDVTDNGTNIIITVTAEDGTQVTYTLTITEKAEYPTSPEIIQTMDINVATPTGDQFYDKSFTNVAPGVYKIAYYFSDVAPHDDNWQMRISPIVSGDGVSEHRCWVDFRYTEYIKASMIENGLSNDIIVIAVVTVPEGYDTIKPGVFFESGLGGNVDKIAIATSDYDFKNVTDYDWCVEKANTADFNEDNGGLMKVADDAWTPSTRASSDATIASVTVDGVAATIDGENITVEVAKADTHTLEVVTTDANATWTASSDGKSITVTAENGTQVTYTLTITEKETEKSSDATIASVTVDGVAATISGTDITVEVAKADTHTVEVVTTDANATWTASSDGKSITVTAEDGTQVTYTLTITEKAEGNGDGTTTNPTNGTVVKDGKTILFKDGKQVTGSTVVTVSGKTYVVIGGYVATGKTTHVVTVSGKSYIVDANGIVQKNGKKQVIKVTSKKSYVVDGNGVVIKSTKNKLVKVTAKKSYVVNKSGVIIKSTKNKLVKVGKKKYVVNKKGVVIKGSKNKLVKVGKKKYVVNKKGVVLKNKKSVKVGKKAYKTNKKGVATLKK